MKKSVFISVIALLACFLVACTSSASYTFGVASGDMIKVTLDTSNGYSIKQDQGHFFVNNGENQVLEGVFLSEQAYDEYDLYGPEITILEEDEKDTFYYYFFEYNDGVTIENNYLIWVFDSKTAVLIGGTSDMEETIAAFDSLTFTLDK